MTKKNLPPAGGFLSSPGGYVHVVVVNRINKATVNVELAGRTEVTDDETEVQFDQWQGAYKPLH